LDRRTDDPDNSGGASPTVVTSRQDGEDLTADNGQDTRPFGIVVPSPLMPRTSDDALSAPPGPSAWDTLAAGAVSGENGKDGPGSAVTDVSAAGDEPAAPDVPATSLFDSAAFSFSTPVPAPDSAGPDSWSLGGPGGPSDDRPFATEAPALIEPDASPPATEPSYSTSYSAVLPAVSPPPAPDPPAVSAAAFTWDTPDPPPTSPASPARTFLRSAGNTKTPAPARAPVTVASPQKTAPVQAPPPVRRAPPKGASKGSVRQAHLTIARVEPWSVMKFSFVVSLVAFVILFIVVSVLWGSLSALGVFESLQRVVSSVTSSQGSNGVNAAKWFSASRVLGWTALLGSLNIVLITAMSTIGAVVYNLTSRLVGGVEVTLRETE
jgi:Transmembrane domain of unknown function (DUF3566)